MTLLHLWNDARWRVFGVLGLFVLCLALLFLCACASADELPNAPKPAAERRVADRRYWTVVGVLAASTAADTLSTAQARDRLGPHGHETNPFLGRHPSNTRLTVSFTSYLAAESFLAYKLKARFGGSKHWPLRMLWMIEPTVQAANHAYFARANAALRSRR